MSPEAEVPQTADPTATAIDPVRQEKVRDLFLSIDKTGKLLRLYGASGKPFLAALDVLAGNFAALLEDDEELPVTVTADGFSATGELHLKGQKREASVPFRLFRDGVRSLRFVRGLDREEVLRLLTAFDTQPDSPARFDDDMATILWRQSFRHIEVAAVDEIGIRIGSASGRKDGPGLAGEVNGRLEELMDSLKSSFFSQGNGMDGGKDDGRLVATSELELLEVRRQAKSSRRNLAPVEDLEIPEPVLAKLRAELEVDDRGGLFRRASAIVGDMVREGECELPPDEARGILGNLLIELLKRGDVAGVVENLDRLSGSGSKSPSCGAILDGLRQRMATEEALKLLLAAASASAASGDGKDADIFRRFLLHLPASALVRCARQIRALRPGPVKGAWEGVLAARGHEEPKALIAWIEEEGGDAAVEALRSVLAAGKVPAARTLLLGLLGHEEERVRAEGLKASSTLPAGERRPLIEKGLRDASSRVRIMAIRAAEAGRDPGLIPILRKRLEECGEGDDEPVRIVHAIGAIGGAEAAACLHDVLAPRRLWPFFWRKRRKARWRRAAVMVLQDIADREVLDLLSEGTSSREKSFADACRTTLGRIESRKRREP
jgi:hypothetical protein